MRSREKKKRNGSAEDARAVREASDNHQQSLLHQPIIYSPPLEPFQETVLLKKPLGLRICKNTLQVTYIEESGASVGRVFVGDIIIAIDGQKISSINELNIILRKSSPMAAVVFKRKCFSKCKHKRTFVEKISVERGREMKCTGRAIDLYLVQMALHINDTIDMNEMIGLSVKYDAKERIQVNATALDSLSSVHLRPGDIIREVNEYPIASKTMLNHFIQAAVIETGQVNFTIESSAGGIDSYHDQVELANDVQEIAQKQIIQFQTIAASKALNLPSILQKRQTNKNCKKIIISQNFVELPIGADYDPTKLKPCKGANIEMRNMQKRDS
ncbi:Chitooligosaccharidolytic beta-N-acetylglucosaminidase [Dirofilaria immitis]